MRYYEAALRSEMWMPQALIALVHIAIIADAEGSPILGEVETARQPRIVDRRRVGGSKPAANVTPLGYPRRE